MEPIESPDPAKADLTQREKRILELIADGADSSMIATTLGLSRESMRQGVASILTKLGVHNRLEAVIRMSPDNDHPHVVPLADADLATHLRSAHHSSFFPDDRPEDLEELRLFHDRMHGRTPPSPA